MTLRRRLEAARQARPDGFYWVVIDEEDGWTIAELGGKGRRNGWWVIGVEEEWQVGFAKIGERIIAPVAVEMPA